MFPMNPSDVDTKNDEKYHVQSARTDRVKDSAITYSQ